MTKTDQDSRFLTVDDFLKSMKEFRAEQEKTDKQIQKTEKQIQETSEQMKNTDKTLKALGINIDGINKSAGEEVETFFYTSLQKNPYLGDIKFDFIDNNLDRSLKGENLQIDIFMENGKSVGLVEVKKKVTTQSISQVKKQIEKFHRFHPSFKDYKIYGAIASKIFPKHLQIEALKNGLFVLLQQGNHLEVTTPK